MKSLNDSYAKNEIFYFCNACGDINLPTDPPGSTECHSVEELPVPARVLFENFWSDCAGCHMYVVRYGQSYGMMVSYLLDYGWEQELIRDAKIHEKVAAIYEDLINEKFLNACKDAFAELEDTMPVKEMLFGEDTDPAGHEAVIFISADAISDELLEKTVAASSVIYEKAKAIFLTSITTPGSMPKNTCIEYLYRDADNYKKLNRHVIIGEVTEKMLEDICSFLDEGEFFKPAMVGLPEEKFGSTTEADHDWFEAWGNFCTPVDAAPDVFITAEDLVLNFRVAAFQNWQEGTEDVAELADALVKQGVVVGSEEKAKIMQTVLLFRTLIELQNDQNFDVANKMRYFQRNVDLDIPLSEAELYILACKVHNASFHSNNALLVEERLDAVRIMLEQGLDHDIRNPDFPDLPAADCRKLLLPLDDDKFTALVDTVAGDNRVYYSEDYAATIHDEEELAAVCEAILALKER